ncbi:MAG: neutral/alkaline non-lysosomal ceramidase N-terminal domain-containing protein, partial [Armatimonadota bacterium]
QRVMDRLEAKGLGPDNLLLCATHNHSGPAGLDQNAVYQYAFGEFDAELFEDMAGRLAAVINDAAGDLKPATLTATAKEVPDLIRNRRGDGAVDPVLTVVKVADLAGEPMAVLVNYGAHPTIVGADNMLISGGYPGALQAAVEERLGNGASVLFSVGSEADQMPEYNGQGDGFTRANDYARQLSDEVWALLQQPGEAAVGPLRCLTQTVVLPPPKVPQNWRHVATDQFMRTLFPAQSTMLTVVRLADVVLVGVPGEIVASLGLQIKQRAQRRSIKHAVIVGLANDYVGYMLTREQYLGGGYESDTGSLYGEDFGELMLRSAADAVDSLLEGRTAA